MDRSEKINSMKNMYSREILFLGWTDQPTASLGPGAAPGRARLSGPALAQEGLPASAGLNPVPQGLRLPVRFPHGCP
jgi:hypothetical protein